MLVLACSLIKTGTTIMDIHIKTHLQTTDRGRAGGAKNFRADPSEGASDNHYSAQDTWKLFSLRIAINIFASTDIRTKSFKEKFYIGKFESAILLQFI